MNRQDARGAEMGGKILRAPGVLAARILPGAGAGLPLLFATTLVVGAALLFGVQPMIAKMVLPQLGGLPAVWNTCLVFFQAALLAGYAYAHVATTRLGLRSQVAISIGLLLLPLGLRLLPVRIAPDAAEGVRAGSDPSLWLLGLLVTAIGWPFFVVATTAPLLQRWFASTDHPAAVDPFFLYGASNLGSMLALLGYPLLIEPNLALARQARIWALGYGLLAILVTACGLAAWARSSPARRMAGRRHSDEATEEARPGLGRLARWTGLAFVPSSLMIGVTTFLSTDIAAVPLLWIVPLAIYLLTFILVFARRPPVPHALMVRLLPTAAVCLTIVLGLGATQIGWVPLHLLAFFLAAMVCHGELARSRPSARRLTDFYLAMSVGGVLGGVFNALIAPVVFDRVLEYPLALVLACLARPSMARETRRLRDGLLPVLIGILTAGLAASLQTGPIPKPGEFGVKLLYGLLVAACLALARHPVRFALAIGALLAVIGLPAGRGGPIELRERSFYGALKIVRVRSGSHEFRQLIHGATLHGQQDLAPDRRDVPLTYFTRSGPIGQVFEEARPATPSVAIVGLGAGSLACYAEPGQRWTFYELDPAVARLARDARYFRFLRDCRADALEVILGDARLRLREAPDRGYGLLVMDAFNSDAVPVHLLTREAVRLYRRKLAPGGLIVANITNKFLDLAPVLTSLARDEGLTCRVRDDSTIAEDEARLGKFPSRWAILAGREADLGGLATDPRWVIPEARPGEPAWTDDFSDLVSHLLIWGRGRR